MKIASMLAFTISAFTVGVTFSSASQAAEPILVFKSGFEGTTAVTKINDSSNSHWRIDGDEGSGTKSNWVDDLQNGTQYFGTRGLLNAESGNDSQRKPEIIVDPQNPNNKALSFKISEHHIVIPSNNNEEKARLQLEIRNDRAVPPAGGYPKEIYFKKRIYFSPNFEILKQKPTDDIGWIILEEYRPENPYGRANALGQYSRIAVGMEKKDGKLYVGAAFRFPEGAIDYTGPNAKSWRVYNETNEVPLGQWMTEITYIKQGRGTEGRFYMSLQPDGGEKFVVVDKIGNTHRPDWISQGMADNSPIKLYTQGRVADSFSAARPMQILYDNLEIWLNRTPESVVPDSPLPVSRPVIQSSLAASATATTPFSYQIVASGAPTAFSASNLPRGLSMNTANGLLSGTPALAETRTVMLGATNAGGTSTAPLVLSVSEAPPPPPPRVSPPSITAPAPQVLSVGSPFSFQIAATGSPTSYGAVGLPAGLTINAATGRISGVPTTVGSSTVTVSATNAGGAGSATLTITVNVATPAITSGALTSAVAGRAFSFRVTANPAATSFGATGLPAGLSIDAASGVISGTPVATGNSTVAVTASNISGTARANLVIQVSSREDAGWQATYFNNIDLTGTRVARTDRTIDFAWGTGGPAAGIGADRFSARWRANLTATTAGTYKLITTTDDGVRLWVNGVLVIDQWVDQSSEEHSANVTLAAGQSVPVVMEYFENTYSASARLEWQGPGVPRQIIPETAVTRATDNSLPGAWTGTDIGANERGSVTEASGVWTIDSAGGDIWDSADVFQYASQHVTGDVTVTACVDSLSDTDPWTKAGIMFRGSAAAGAPHASVVVTPARGAAFMRRPQPDSASIYTGAAGIAAPYCLKLVRTGNTIIASTSTNSKNWVELRRDTVTLGNSILVGLVVSSHSSTASARATFSRVTIQPAARTN